MISNMSSDFIEPEEYLMYHISLEEYTLSNAITQYDISYSVNEKKTTEPVHT